jgi:ribosomal protein S27E
MTTSTAPSEDKGGFGDFGKQKEFPCDTCGAKLTFSIGAQKLKCEHCGTEKELMFGEDAKVVERDLDAALRGQAQRRASSGQFAGSHEVKCSACGATVVFQGTLTSSSCAYCDAPIQREKAHEMQHRIAVDGLCTFQIEKETASKKLKEWVRSRWFAPNDFKQRGVEGRFDGVYMPYFTFDAMTYTRYSGERGDAYWVTEGSGQNQKRVRKIRWSSARGSFQRFFDDVLIPALKSLPQKLLQSLEPWPLEKMIPFTDQALSGKLAHTYEIELGESFGLAKQRINDELHKDVRRRIGGDEQRIHSVDTSFSALTYKHVLLPVWILAYRYAGKSYRVVVNAMTGQVSGERPYSPIKIALAVIGGIIGLIVLYALFGGGEHPRHR